jgi:hypothetical protein
MEDHLYILWTNADSITAEKMVFMYGRNAKKRGWWKDVTLIIWGATAKLCAEDESIRLSLAEMKADGVRLEACKACADQLGATEILEGLGVEVSYWGERLTGILKSGERILTI